MASRHRLATAVGRTLQFSALVRIAEPCRADAGLLRRYSPLCGRFVPPGSCHVAAFFFAALAAALDGCLRRLLCGDQPSAGGGCLGQDARHCHHRAGAHILGLRPGVLDRLARLSGRPSVEIGLAGRRKRDGSPLCRESVATPRSASGGSMVTPRVHGTNGQMVGIGLAALLVLVLGVVQTPKAFAGTGAVLSLPTTGVKPTSGLRLDIDTRWLDGPGYRPIRIRLSTVGLVPSAADRAIRITLSTRHWLEKPVVRTTATVLLPQGQSSIEQTVLMPMSNSLSRFEVRASEGRTVCRDLSSDTMNYSVTTSWSEVFPTILVIDPAAPPLRFDTQPRFAAALPAKAINPAHRLPDLRTLAHTCLEFNTYGFSSDVLTTEPLEPRQLLQVIDTIAQVLLVPAESLPESWLGLTAVDLMAISWPELERLGREERPRWEAIRQWVESGGVLMIWGLQPTDEQLGAVEAAWGWSPRQPDESQHNIAPESGSPNLSATATPTTSEAGPAGESDQPRDASDLAPPAKRNREDDIQPLRGWSAATNEQVVSQVPFLDNNFVVRTPPSAEEADPFRVDDPTVVDRVRQSFRFREAGLGQIVVLFEPHPFPGDRALWASVLNALGPSQVCRMQRQGFSVARKNPTFWTWLIPGIGTTPIKSFVVLISLFVIVIGPVNYYLLLRQRRLSLLMLTVPTLALLMTFGSLGFILVWEGLGVRCRVRSITELDTVHGRAISWSRQTYYASLAPSGGLQFPADAAVYPIDFRGSMVNRPSYSNRSVVWPESSFVPADLSAATRPGSSTQPAPGSLAGEPSSSGTLSATTGQLLQAGSPGQQQLVAGFLPSRTYSQFVVIQPQFSSARLEVTTTADTLRIRNRLGVAIERLILRAKDGKLYEASQVAAGAESPVTQIDAQAAHTVWNAILTANAPTNPAGLLASELDDFRGVFSSSYYIGGDIDSAYGEPNLLIASPEIRLQRAVTNNFSGLSSGTFLALTEDGPHVARGLSKVSRVRDFHVVLGNW